MDKALECFLEAKRNSREEYEEAIKKGIEICETITPHDYEITQNEFWYVDKAGKCYKFEDKELGLMKNVA